MFLVASGRLSEMNQSMTRTVSRTPRNPDGILRLPPVPCLESQGVVPDWQPGHGPTLRSGPAAKEYIDPQVHRAGIQLELKGYSGYPEYSQRSPPSSTVLRFWICVQRRSRCALYPGPRVTAAAGLKEPTGA